MKQVRYKLLLLAGLLPLFASMISGCTEDLGTELTAKRIMLALDDSGFDDSRSVTRGAKVTSISSFGVSAAAYDASASYTSAGCGSYFYKQSATNGSPLGFFWPTADYKLAFYAYYPYGNAAFTVQSSASTTGAPTYSYTVPSAIASQVDVMTGQTVNVLGGGASPVAISMKHRCAAVCFSVTNDRSSAITLSSISIEGVKYTGTLCEETWTLSSAVNSSSVNPFTLSYGSSIAAGATVNVTGTSNIFLMLPQSIPAGAKLKVSIAGEDPMYADLSGSWVAGKQYNYSLNVSSFLEVHESSEIEDWATTIDLSLVDNAGNARASMTTANCYLVHRAGTYKIPLVYGNAIKDGAVNTEAFNPTGTSGTSFLKPFINHAGNGITGPWITKSGSGVNAGMGLAATSAELLWQDAYPLISNVSISGDYLKFTIRTFNKGNALIAVKSGSTILWSWHIWATSETLSTTTSIATGSRTYNVSPCFLGWISTGGNGKQGYCTYYQWGRKDPFIPCEGNTKTAADKTVYNLVGFNITPTSITQSSNAIQFQKSTSATIADNIMNPIRVYCNSSTGSSCNTTQRNLWDARQTSYATNITTKTIKTIYDPCPPEFCVPTSNLFYYIGNGSSRTDSSWDSTNKGKSWTLNSPYVWFPAIANRIYTSGELNTSNVGHSVYVHSSTAEKGFYVYNKKWVYMSVERASVLVILPVKE